MVSLFRGQGIQAVGVRDPDIGENPSEGLFSLPGNLSPEQTLLDEQNIEKASQFIDGIRDAFERAKIHGLGFEGSKTAKRIFEVLPHEAGLAIELLADRLTLSWLDRNNDQARELVNHVREKLQLK